MICISSLSCILGLFCIFIACQSRKNNDQSSVASDKQFHVEVFREINLADHLPTVVKSC